MKLLFTLLFLSCLHFAQAQYSSPESVEYDFNHNRYLVANTGSNTVKQVIPGQSPANFVTATSPYGIAIVGDTVYVCSNNTHLRGYNLTSGTLAFDVNLGGTFLNGICTDFAGNLFVTDFSAKKIVRYNIATQQFNYFVGTTMAKTPNGIVYDPFHHRLVIATWGPNAPILGLSMSDSTITTLKATTLTNIDGISIDEDGNFYVADWGSDGIYFFDSAFTNAPVRVVSGLSNPADISYNILSDTLAVPNTSNNTVTFCGFPRPRPVADFDTVTVGYDKTICVLQNDLIDGNAPLLLQTISGAQLGTATSNANCIQYTSSGSGNDTLSYVVCSVDTPSFCRTGVLIVTNVASGGSNLPPVAQNDTGITLNTINVNVAANDMDAIGDTLCITSITGSAFFSVAPGSCTNIIFTADSSFTGNDTCWYVICDNGTPALCDTASLIITVIEPVHADFMLDMQNSNCYQIIGINTSTGDTDTAMWAFMPMFGDTIILYGDTAHYLISTGLFPTNVCIYVSNQIRNDTLCQNYDIICEGIADGASLSGIRLYPNPANSFLTVDMEKSSDEVTRNYAAIEIFDHAGKKQTSIGKTGNNKIATIDVSGLPAGIYMAVIVSDKNEKRTLGRFAIAR